MMISVSLGTLEASLATVFNDFRISQDDNPMANLSEIFRMEAALCQFGLHEVRNVFV